MTVDKAKRDIKDVVAWINATSTGIEISSDKRSQIASACFDVAIEHQAAIALLADAELYGSMLALFRVCKEAQVRGLWLFFCASEHAISRFEKGKIDKSFGELVKEIEENLGVSALSNLKEKAWSAMNDFTHTGYIQVTRRHAPERLGSNYPDSDIIGCLRVSTILGLLASVQLVDMAGREDLVKLHFEKVNEIVQSR